MAVAAGAMQVAAIKKQQQASQAQGYGEGGFTRKGRADEVASVVHAGENLCKPNANELARFAEAPPSLSNQAQDEYQRLMNNKSPKNKRK